MGTYYYLMAQLPYLFYEQKPPLSSEAFKALSESLMSKKDIALLNILSLDPPEKATGCKFIDAWRNWENDLRMFLAKERAIKLKRDLPEKEPVYHMDIAAAASKAVDEYSPLEGEILLDKARWHAIDELAGSDYFHSNNVFAYYLKLLLLERRQVFNAEKGFAEYKSLYDSIVENVHKAGDPK